MSSKTVAAEGAWLTLPPHSFGYLPPPPSIFILYIRFFVCLFVCFFVCLFVVGFFFFFLGGGNFLFTFFSSIVKTYFELLVCWPI